MSKRQRRKIEGFSADYRGVYGDKPAEQPETAEPPQDIEIDDFLPEEQQDEGEELLTKWDDGLEPEPEEPEVPERPARTVRRRRHRYGVAVGALVLILALVGVGFIAAAIGKSIYFAATDDSKLRAYDSFLTTVVMQDPKPFASPDKADEEFVLNASLWKTITENNGTNYNSYDDAGRILVPLGDVVDSCRALFGPDCQLQPKTPAQETFFEYNSEENQFHVALYSSDSSFLPYTESAKKQGDSTVLHVGYVSPSDTWRTQTTSTVAAPTPTKYMDYVLKTDPSTGQEYVYAIQAPEG
ncbi:hypothetical protein [Caproiciproducens sp. CPB-2]|jgi:hypothetical protein|uniref:hypothetical protein n=1 Tax=unclassified Caproiciproducens TaxID=2643836 RepID=UPI0023DCD569|nr:hypothetical protein [Caproiciproducens sp. CPB-2]MDF1494449.1 hypothetical protein [Caproiciproducens sp. CPB-2]